jgi:hypothetical protein
MPPISLLADNIISRYPYTFSIGEDFKWSPDISTIYYPGLTSIEDIWSLLHEVAHAELQHATYDSDVQLVSQEAQAWKHAEAKLAPTFSLIIDTDYIEDHLDTYRLWLHHRSTCPNCGQNGLQTKNTYSCLNCRCLWQANEARICNLRRTKLRQ